MILIACDLDRTLIPNGAEPYDESLPKFYDLISKVDDVVLAYVTGRNYDLFINSQKDYGIKNPDYLLASVGTEIFKKEGEDMRVYKKWGEYLRLKQPNWDREKLISDIGVNDEFYLQEEEMQNPYKISFYIKDEERNKDLVLKKVKRCMLENDIDEEIIYSFDPIKNIGLLDVLPKSATKKGALEFLIAELGITKEDAIFAGDSGNDLLALTSGIKSILVKNASQFAKDEAKRIVKDKGIEDKLYIAKGEGEMNGNYASGVIEGLKYFGVII